MMSMIILGLSLWLHVIGWHSFASLPLISLVALPEWRAHWLAGIIAVALVDASVLTEYNAGLLLLSYTVTALTIVQLNRNITLLGAFVVQVLFILSISTHLLSAGYVRLVLVRVIIAGLLAMGILGVQWRFRASTT